MQSHRKTHFPKEKQNIFNEKMIGENFKRTSDKIVFRALHIKDKMSKLTKFLKKSLKAKNSEQQLFFFLLEKQTTISVTEHISFEITSKYFVII